MQILSPKSPKTNDAVILLIVNNSSAAFAHIKLVSFSFLSYIAIAIVSFVISASLTILAILLLMPVKGFCENVVPQYVSIEHTNTLGLYQAPSEIVLYKEPYQSSNIVHSISWIGDKIFPESVKANDLFIVFLPQKMQ